MARIRSIKPEFWADRKLAKRTSRDARLLYVGLWNLADEESRLNGDPLWIKGQVFPFEEDLDAAAVDALLKELDGLERIVRYEVDDDPYIYLPKLAGHQRLDDRVKSKLPGPPMINTDKSVRDADESVRPAAKLPFNADPSGPDADSSTLLYGAGSMEHGTGSMVARARETALVADELLTEHLGKLSHRPPKDVVQETGSQIDRLLADKTEPGLIREALARWRGKGKYPPSLLPKLVADIQAETAKPGSRASPRGHRAYRNPDDDSAYEGKL